MTRLDRISHGSASNTAVTWRKLNDIETALSALVLGHEGLRTAKLFGHLLLGQVLPCAAISWARNRWWRGTEEIWALGEPVKERPAQRLISFRIIPFWHILLGLALNWRGSQQP